MPVIFELIFFAIIAFLIISKLISTLGTTNEDDKVKYKSYFGEQNVIKDVTATSKNNNEVEDRLKSLMSEDTDNIILASNKDNIIQSLLNLQNKIPNFTPEKFVRGAKSAFRLIIEAASNNNVTTLTSLIDKRYLIQFQQLMNEYGAITGTENLHGKISDIYMFGNNVFIKILFSGNNVSDKITKLQEEWTFTKSLIKSAPDWYLTNIEKSDAAS